MNVLLSLILPWALFQFPPPGTFGELQFPRMSTPYGCSAGREGRVYYDLDVDLPYYCDDTNWVPFGTTISGTFPFVPRFNSAGTNIENSIIQAAGFPSAGTSGSATLVAGTLAAMDGTDTVKLLDIDAANASHSGAGNILRGIYIDSISGSSNASEEAIVISTGWDFAFISTASAFRINGSIPAAGSNFNLMDLGGTLAAMDGGDTVRIINGTNLVNANHTGSPNVLIYMDLVGITGDADATEIGFQIGNGWDWGIEFEDNTGNQAHLYWEDSTSTAIFDSADTAPDYTFRGNGTVLTNLQDGREFTHLMGTDLVVVGAAQNVDPNSNTVEISAALAASVTTITPPTATSHTEEVTFVCNGLLITFNDSDAAGAANTINLAGAATPFVCSGDDTLTLKFLVAPAAGNARWVEVSRSVN